MIRSHLGFIFDAHVCLLATTSCDSPKPTTSATATASTAASTASTAAASAAATASATAPASATASAAPEADLPNHLDGAVVAAVAGIAPAPSSWKGVPEVTVTGSTRAGCTTKVSGAWFRAYCVSDEETGFGRLKSATIITGLRPGQTQLVTRAIGKDAQGRDIPAYEITTPYVKGTSFSFNLRWMQGSNLDMVVEWPADKATAPERVGIVKQAPQRDAIP